MKESLNKIGKGVIARVRNALEGLAYPSYEEVVSVFRHMPGCSGTDALYVVTREEYMSNIGMWGGGGIMVKTKYVACGECGAKTPFA